ncbi:MAG TPA: caspase family protein [Coleofasciculaceae cyanobacterium]
MGLTRRTFLRQMGLALTACGLSEVGLALLSDRYQQAIAQPTRRKLALLVGINQYSESVCDYSPAKGTALTGCLTDVALQQELLGHRFGFQASDILTLTDQQATRQAIVDAFQSHLTAQARPGDVVVFHFSGLGSRIKLQNPGMVADSPEQTSLEQTSLEQNSLVPVDGWLPTEENPLIHDLMAETLGGLLRSLATEQIITFLDTSYTTLGRTLQGNLHIRSRPNAPSGEMDLVERGLQAQLSRQAGISPDQMRSQWRSGQLPGLLLSAAGDHQVATEGQWNGFSAGVFTYALTQQLWRTTPATTLYFSLSQATGAVRQTAGLEQLPGLTGKGQSIFNLLPPNGEALPSADGAITAVDEEGRAQVWLAGLPAAVIENYGASLLEVQAEGAKVLVQVRSRDGLMFKTRLPAAESAVQAGQLVQERVRILPRNVGLTVAIDASLERIERVDATSAFSAIPKVSLVKAGEQPADFLFGKKQPTQTLTASLSPLVTDQATPAERPDAKELGLPSPTEAKDLPAPLVNPQSFPAKSSYGLFYPGRDAIPSTLIQEDEAVKTAVNRMTPQLQTLLATKLLRLTENQGSSRLGVRAALELVTPQAVRLLMQQETPRATWKPPALRSPSSPERRISPDALTLPVGSQIQYRLTNYSDRPLYFVVLGLDAAGNPIAFYPLRRTGTAYGSEETTLLPDIPLTIPPTEAADWKLQTGGLAETHLICSATPLTQTYQTLETALRSKTDARRMALLSNPLEVVQALLQDLHEASIPGLPEADIPADSYAIDVNAWATFSFIYQVI